MVRIVIKGGVWKNTEDEILKAAISKYGKNQWARISSLLVRKTPKQCKARWYEWLDPSIKKTEWSKEEDEKLLHLAKLMPTQWRTIAPIVGRTATQCLERYQKLLDEAESREGREGEASGSGLGLTGPGGPESAPSAEDVRKLRPGEIDPDPETKPARPDPVDMDEDEKEMLSEARARLANTQGKKAKRKARERALEEARRLAMLQKRRELKAAGINTRLKPPKKGMDYMTDIPFEKQPVAGFYDTSDENARSVRAPIGQTIRQLDDPNRARHEEDARKQKQKEADKKKQSEQGKAVFSKEKEEQLRKLREAEQISKRRRLNLPEAQVGQRELDEIVKMGMAGETSRKLVADGVESTEGLLGEYSALDRARDARTPRTAPEEDTVMREARNLRNMANMQTPLLGDANVEMLTGTGHQGALPSTAVSQTPNPLLTPAHRGKFDPGATPMNGRAAAPSATPRSEVGATPMRTPFRDNLGLNADDMSVISQTPRDLKRAQRDAKAQLQMGLRGLPAPKNDFELLLDEETDTGNEQTSDTRLIEEDAGERDERLKKIAEEERKKEMARRSQVVQRDLPRPANVDVEVMLAALPPLSISDPVDVRAQRMIAEEMVHLLKHDSVINPIAGSKQVGGLQNSGLPTIPDENLARARKEIHQEMATAWGFPGANEEVLKRVVLASVEDGAEATMELEAALQAQRDGLMWSADKKQWLPKEEMSTEERLEGQAARLDAIREEMTRQAGVAAKEEKRLAKILGGYQARSKALGGDITAAYTALRENEIQLLAFDRLMGMEGVAATERRKALEADVQVLERRERLAQNEYKEREERKRLLQEEIDAMEDELAMREAEKLNEQALAAE